MSPLQKPRRRWTRWLAAVAVACALDVAVAAPEAHRHAGMANASAVAALGGPWFAVASDESNVLRVYRSDQDGGPASMLDLSPGASLRGKSDEIDIEGGARVGDRVYWIGSHGRSREGKPRPNRQRLLATRVVGSGENVRLEVTGLPYGGLMRDLLADPRYAALGLAAASKKAPEHGGINIEGLAATPGEGLVAGFRSPLVQGKALLATILNPAEAIEGKRAVLGPPLLLDLDGHGIRDITWTGSEWYVIGGGVQGAGKARLYRWAGGTSNPLALKDTGFKRFHPEALAARRDGSEGRLELLVLSDDGRDGSNGGGGEPAFRSFVVVP